MNAGMVDCKVCGAMFNREQAISDKRLDEKTGVCRSCYDRLAADPNSCFGKQYHDGTPLAQLGEHTCSQCPDYSVCSKWPKNSVVWKHLTKAKGDIEMGEKKKKEKKTPPPEPKGKAAAARATGKKAEAPATAKTKKATKQEPKAFVEFAKDLKFREGTSIVVVMRALTSKPEITLDDCCKILTDSGVPSDNVRARVMKGFSYMKERDLMGKKIEGDKIIFYKK